MNPLSIEKEKKVFQVFLPFRVSRHFSFLYLSQMLSSLGSSITQVILPIIVFQMTHSVAQMGIIMALSILPNVIMLPFAGIFVDRINKIKIMIVIDSLRFFMLSILTILALLDNITINVLYTYMFISSLVGTLFQPAYSSVRAKIFTKDIRNAANSLTQVGQRITRLIGPTLGGVVITTFSAGWGLALDAVTFILSVYFLFKLRNITFQRSEHGSSKGFSFKKDFFEGIEVLKQKSWLWITILFFSLINICSGGIGRVLIPWLINVHYHFEPVVYGLILTASSAGSIACGIMYGIKKQWNRRGVTAYLGVFFSGSALLIMPFVHNAILLMIFMFINGAGIMLFALIWETSLQELVPEDKYGRVASLDMFGSFSLMPLGYLLTGWCAEALGEIHTIILLCTVILLLSLLAMVSRGVRQFN